MRLTALYGLALAMVFVSGGVYAADEFGARFTHDAPSAFGDPSDMSSSNALAMDMDEAMKIMNDIMPAAGDETGDMMTDEAVEAESASGDELQEMSE